MPIVVKNGRTTKYSDSTPVATAAGDGTHLRPDYKVTGKITNAYVRVTAPTNSVIIPSNADTFTHPTTGVTSMSDNYTIYTSSDTYWKTTNYSRASIKPTSAIDLGGLRSDTWGFVNEGGEVSGEGMVAAYVGGKTIKTSENTWEHLNGTLIVANNIDELSDIMRGRNKRNNFASEGPLAGYDEGMDSYTSVMGTLRQFRRGKYDGIREKLASAQSKVLDLAFSIKENKESFGLIPHETVSRHLNVLSKQITEVLDKRVVPEGYYSQKSSDLYRICKTIGKTLSTGQERLDVEAEKYGLNKRPTVEVVKKVRFAEDVKKEDGGRNKEEYRKRPYSSVYNDPLEKYSENSLIPDAVLEAIDKIENPMYYYDNIIDRLPDGPVKDQWKKERDKAKKKRGYQGPDSQGGAGPGDNSGSGSS